MTPIYRITSYDKNNVTSIKWSQCIFAIDIVLESSTNIYEVVLKCLDVQEVACIYINS